MKYNNITTAPQMMDTDNMYKVWRTTHAGNSDTFYRFMTTPSPARDKFISRLNVSVTHDNKVVLVAVS